MKYIKEVLNLSVEELREWYFKNHATCKECFVNVNLCHGNNTNTKSITNAKISYLDALEVALCFGWIDSTKWKDDKGRCIQRFSPRKKNSKWTELNKARAQKLIKLQLMTASGEKAYEQAQKFYISEEILCELKKNTIAYENFNAMPELYRRIRIDNIQRYRHNSQQFHYRIHKLISNCEKNIMYGNWNDNGRLITCETYE